MQNNEMIQNYDEIFTDDKLDIKSNVIDFAHLIEQDTHKTNQTSKVYSISAEFGIGKTFFCDKLLQVLSVSLFIIKTRYLPTIQQRYLPMV